MPTCQHAYKHFFDIELEFFFICLRALLCHLIALIVNNITYYNLKSIKSYKML